ncbi:hypothetical protein [Bradyrhizobium sp. 930_D9_N1_4]|uniref:hypothetical protein n=1 Tax=Bradyrhizobium sp. 930_D9_N1_4 TaxID=3240374 RepID=UPI003F8B1E09
MILWTISELARLTAHELYDLERTIREELWKLELGSIARSHALASLENIRRLLIQRDLHP